MTNRLALKLPGFGFEKIPHPFNLKAVLKLVKEYIPNILTLNKLEPVMIGAATQQPRAEIPQPVLQKPLQECSNALV